MRRGKQIVLGYLLASLVIWICLGGYYGFRFIYSYINLQDAASINTSLALTNLNELIMEDKVNSGDGLHSRNDGTYYYYGDVSDNYVYYSGLTWRIMGIDENGYIQLISQDNLYASVFSTNESNNYFASRVYSILQEKVFNLLDEPQKYLYYQDFCIGSIDSSEVSTCELKPYYEYVGLLSVAQYNEAGGSNSYLNTNSAFWTSNSDSETTNKVYYITSNGEVSKSELKESDNGIYSIRPTILLKSNFNIIKGKGTSASPYILYENTYENLKDVKLGSYVSYSNKLWRVIEENSDGVRLLAADVIKNSSVDSIKEKENEKGIFMSEYGGATYSSYITIGELINDYKDDLDRNYLEYTYFDNGYYGDTNYKVQGVENLYNSISAPTPEDFLVTSKTSSNVNYWTSCYINSTSEFIDIVTSGGSIGSDYSENENAFRPVVNIDVKCKIVSGSGTSNDPYIINLES